MTAFALNNWILIVYILPGADTPVYLALLPPNTTSPKGKFVSDRTVQEWPSIPQAHGH